MIFDLDDCGSEPLVNGRIRVVCRRIKRNSKKNLKNWKMNWKNFKKNFGAENVYTFVGAFVCRNTPEAERQKINFDAVFKVLKPFIAIKKNRDTLIGWKKNYV